MWCRGVLHILIPVMLGTCQPIYRAPTFRILTGNNTELCNINQTQTRLLPPALSINHPPAHQHHTTPSYLTDRKKVWYINDGNY